MKIMVDVRIDVARNCAARGRFDLEILVSFSECENMHLAQNSKNVTVCSRICLLAHFGAIGAAITSLQEWTGTRWPFRIQGHQRQGRISFGLQLKWTPFVALSQLLQMSSAETPRWSNVYESVHFWEIRMGFLVVLCYKTGAIFPLTTTVHCNDSWQVCGSKTSQEPHNIASNQMLEPVYRKNIYPLLIRGCVARLSGNIGFYEVSDPANKTFFSLK